ncbi:MAG: Transcriptional regulatory protein SrrA [Pelotomaculum sp. PtaB.Bin013]|uniref:Stage 0 sporulation protein A homolog n=1 Tax=Pelotomaculum isophthalicicum JI TaxID=947010 RepID=A0A9X4H383_9FIRM|nr:response regulator transcription factor [Pelotomaculum isophthalicicum]MDF9408926.1 response regulator transcription factor [Pelotomaculum isophthalicicum JI]OPX89574.1 MAG: Transcriptional regulatory protein SrrA [Pelotomaculum sp. PtaB.Bin013]
MQTVMVVEDDHSIALLLKTYLEHAGFQTQVAVNGEEALSMFSEVNPALVLLDLMLPGKDGWTVLDEIRQLNSCPVIMVTARGAVEDRLHGFDKGADDYILKPFDPDEVVARVKAVLRRPVHLVEPELVQFGTLVINFTSREVTVKGKPISLAPRHWELLTFLVRHPNQVFTRDQLLDHVWGMDYDGGDRAVDVSVKRIRQSLQEWPADEGEIATIRGKGYLLRVK